MKNTNNVKKGLIGGVLVLMVAFLAAIGLLTYLQIGKGGASAASTIEVLSFDSRVFFVPENKEPRNFAINAKLKLSDGSVQNSAQALHFASSDEILTVDENGNMKVESDVFGANAGYDPRPVTVTVTCDYEKIKPKSVNISVVPYPQYSINLDANGGNVSKRSVDAWEGQTVDDPNTTEKETLPAAELDGAWTFEGWFRVLEDGTLESRQFDESDKYYWGKDIQLRARYSAKLSLDDDMGGDRQTIEQKFYYKEDIPSESLLPELEPKDGWNFEGWYTRQGGQGVKYGSAAADEIYASPVPILYAKWTCQRVKCVYEATSSQKDAGEVVYNAEFTFDDLDFGNGELAYWYIFGDEGEEIKLLAGGRYKLPANATLYAKVKYRLMLHWQDAPHEEAEQCYAVYGDTLASMGWTLPTPTLVDGVDSDGWRFEGWYRDEGTYLQKFDEDTLFENEGAIDLYALRKSDFTLYNQLKMEDGSVVATNEGRKTSVTYGKDLSLGANPALNGDWTFGGFFTNKDGTGEQVTSTTDYKGKGSRELYAKWTTTVTLSNDERLLTNTKFNTTFAATYNAAISEANLPTEVLYKGDGLFMGWYTEQYGDGERVQAGDTFDFTGKITLYTKVQFEITINYQEATDKDGGAEKYNVIFGKSIEESVDDYIGGRTPLKTGWTFDGYFYGDNSQNETKYELDTQEFVFDHNLSLYVRWKGKLTVYGVMSETFDDKNSTEVDMYFNRPLPLSELIEENRTVNGWVFNGWSKDPAYGAESGEDPISQNNKTTIDPKEVYKGDGTFSVYARWKGTISFKKTLSNSTLEISELDLLYNTVPTSLPVPTRPESSDNGYKFVGWYDVDFSPNNTEVLGNKLSDKDRYIGYVSGVTFYEGVKFTLSFSAKESNDNVEDIDVFYHKTLKVSLAAAGKEKLADVARAGSDGKQWHFGGWFYKNETKMDEDYVYGFGENAEVEARWESAVTLYLNGNGGVKWDQMTDIEQSVTLYVPEGDKLTEHLTDVPQSWGSWEIEGWYKTASYSAAYDKTEAINTPELELHAKWVAKNIKVNYFDDDITVDQLGREIVYGQSFGALPDEKSVERKGYNKTAEWYSTAEFSEGSQIKIDTTTYPKTFDNLYLRWDPKTYTVFLSEYFISSGHVMSNKSIQVKYGEKIPSLDAPVDRDGKSCYSYKYEDGASAKEYLIAGKDSAGKNILVGCTIWDMDKDNIILMPVLVAKLQDVTLQDYKNDEGKIPTVISASVDRPLPDMDITRVKMKVGYDFLGYFNKEVGDGTQYFDAQMHYIKKGNWEDGDTILYPRFEVQKINVTLDKYNGDIDNAVTGTVESKLPDLDKRKAPTQTGYKFIGYFTKKDGGGTKYYDADMKYCKEGNWTYGDTTLYPKFEVISYKITIVNTEDSRLWVRTISPMTTYNPMKAGTTNGFIIGTAAYGKVITFSVSGDKCKARTRSIKTADNQDVTYEGAGDWTWRFTMPASDIVIQIGCDTNHCVVAGTLITLADGTQKPVEELKGDEMLLVWNLFTGQFDVAPILFVDHDPESEYMIINLSFSDGTIVKVISEHAFWDYNFNEWVFLREDAAKYLGHWFNKQDVDSEGNMINRKVQLVDVTLTTERTTAWSPVTFGHLCYYVNGMLSMPGATEGLINIFDVDPQTMKIDEEKMAADIEKYGLFTYDDFAEYIPEEVYYAFNGQYLKVAIGKGLITWESLIALIDNYTKFWTEV